MRSMTIRRSREIIFARILETCIHSATKTKIVQQANLNFQTINSYLEKLVKMKLLLLMDGDPALYKTTEKGLEILKRLRSIQKELALPPDY